MIKTLRGKELKTLAVGNHEKIIQSILDFDTACGKSSSGISAVITNGRQGQKFFWGEGETIIRCYASIEEAQAMGVEANMLLNMSSANSSKRMVDTFFSNYPDAIGCHIFAENVSERDALSLVHTYGQQKLIAGPSGVGLYVPGSLKLGAIGGIDQAANDLLADRAGSVAIICSSGGMTNELMHQLARSGAGISFAVSYGGDRFPITSAKEWVLLAEQDLNTKSIVFFGELGGKDEYEIAQALSSGLITKPLHVYIAGRYQPSGKSQVQFGHAKALAREPAETADAKMEVLRKAGAKVFEDFSKLVEGFGAFEKVEVAAKERVCRKERRKSLFSHPTLPPFQESVNFTEAILKRLLLRNSVSKELVQFVDQIFIELIDHGPHVSGAINTMVTTRAGKDLPSSLATGLLTIGDRFGGAITESAQLWHTSVKDRVSPDELVRTFASKRQHIPGIGHLKYNAYKLDPRIKKLLGLAAEFSVEQKHIDFAHEVEANTLKKRSNLILNIDGTIAACLLDLLYDKEGCGEGEVSELIEIGFFNAMFIIPRMVGFTGNHFDQKRIDEGLVRLQDDDVFLQ